MKSQMLSSVANSPVPYNPWVCCKFLAAEERGDSAVTHVVRIGNVLWDLGALGPRHSRTFSTAVLDKATESLQTGFRARRLAGM